MKDWKTYAIILLLIWAAVLQLQVRDNERAMLGGEIARLDMLIRDTKQDLQTKTEADDAKWKALFNCAAVDKEFNRWTTCVYQSLERSGK
jgi:hypothetical protein